MIGSVNFSQSPKFVKAADFNKTKSETPIKKDSANDTLEIQTPQEKKGIIKTLIEKVCSKFSKKSENVTNKNLNIPEISAEKTIETAKSAKNGYCVTCMGGGRG